MTVTTKPLSDSVGAEVLDVDRDRMLHDDTLADECLELLDRHGVLVFRELHLDDDTQVAFSKRLGPVERVGRRDDGAEIFRVTLDPAKNPAADYLKGTFDWHIDGMTDDIPIMATVLSAHEVAATGGDTEFASTYAAYEDARRRGAGAGARPRGSCTPSSPPRSSRTRTSSEADIELWRKRPPKTHPLVWRHGNGRKSLVLGATTAHVEGMRRGGRARLPRRAARPLDRARAGVPARVGGRRPRHLGQPRRAAPRHALRRVVGTRHAPHDHRRRRGDAVTAAGVPGSHRSHPTSGVTTWWPGIAALRPAGATEELRRSKGGPKGLNVLGTLAQHPDADAGVPHVQRPHPLHQHARRPVTASCWCCGSRAVRGGEYEWSQHVYIGVMLGLSDDDIARIAEGPHAPGWSPFDAAMLRAVDELVRDARSPTSTWAVLAGELDRQQLMDLVFTVGAYDLLAMAFQSFGVEFDADLDPAVT